MRYRLMCREDSGLKNSTSNRGQWSQVGGVRTGDSAAEVLRDYGPRESDWLVLCEDDKTWQMFTVTKRTETDITPREDVLGALTV